MPTPWKGFSGKCYLCGNIGHPARLCPNAGKGTNRLADDTEESQIGGCWQLSFIEQCEECEGANKPKDLHSDINAIEEDDECDWEYVKLTIDSGPIDTVAPPTMAEGVEIEPAEASNAGKNWKAANNTVIKNLGKKKIEACTDEGHSVMLDVQIAENLTKFLGSAFRTARAGNSVVFHPPGYDDYIYNWDTGKYTKVEEEKGAYNVGMWVKAPEVKKEDEFTPVSPKKGGSQAGNSLNLAHEQIQLTVSPQSDTQRPQADTASGQSSERVVLANEEAEEPVCVRGELKPSDAEIRAHNLTHLPFRSWCPHCVRGKAVAGVHRRKEQDRERVQHP